MESDWSINVPNFGVVRVTDLLLKKLNSYRQLTSSQPESGGVLIGKFLNSNGVLLIDDLTEPQPQDVRKRHEFYRSSQHNNIVRQAWKSSDKTSTYVGLWHTHPENTPEYSGVDKKDWVNSLKKSNFDGNSLFFIIVGKTHIKCWYGQKNVGCEIKYLAEKKNGK